MSFSYRIVATDSDIESDGIEDEVFRYFDEFYGNSVVADEELAEVDQYFNRLEEESEEELLTLKNKSEITVESPSDGK